MDAVTPPAELIDEDWCTIAETARRLGRHPRGHLQPHKARHAANLGQTVISASW
jgi:hypothetical protein